MKKIYFLVDEFPRLGGGEVVTDRLAQELTVRDIDVTVICRTPGFYKIQERSYTVQCWSPLSYAQKRSALQGLSLIMQPLGLLLIVLRKINMLSMGVNFTEKILSRRIASTWDKDDVVIATRGDILDVFLTQSGLRGNKENLPIIINQFHTSLDPLGEYGAFLEESQKNCDVIDGLTVLSRRCKESFIQGWGIPVLVLPNPNPTGEGKKLRDFSKTVVVAARFVESKQIDVSIRAFKKFVSDAEFSDWNMKIYGAGAEEANLRALVKGLNLESQIAFMGLSSPGEMFAQAGLHLMCSRFEGWSLVTQEAGCYGVPTVAFDVSGGVHSLVTSLNGGLAELGDIEGLVTLMKSHALLSSQQEHAQKIMEQSRRYDVEEVATYFLRWLDKLRVT